jgi:putative membrane protein
MSVREVDSRLIKYLTFISAATVIAATAADAHDGRPHGFNELWRYWGEDPLVIAGLSLSGWLYIRGARRLWRRSAPGRGIRKWEAAAFAAGWFSLFIALLSPLHPWSEVLFSAHMTQHEILLLVSAPLLVLGRPLIPSLWALPIRWRRGAGALSKAGWFRTVWRAITLPLAAWAIHAFALWIWHMPVLFQAALRSDFIHFLQHLCFLASALLFWWAMIHGPQGLKGYGGALLCVFTTAMHSGLLGALITFASVLWYPAYEGTTASWGLTPMEDQQLAGLFMWVPAGVLYMFAGLLLLVGWLRESERKVLHNEAMALLRQESK